MPQIWPMNWVLLFMFFILVFLSFTTLMYFFNYSVTVQESESCSKIESILCDWKW